MEHSELPVREVRQLYNRTLPICPLLSHTERQIPPSSLPPLPCSCTPCWANFRASSLDPRIQMEVFLHPCLAEEHLSWMCSTERSKTPSGHVKGVLEGREGGALRKSKRGCDSSCGGQADSTGITTASHTMPSETMQRSGMVAHYTQPHSEHPGEAAEVACETHTRERLEAA
ncbi:hypothetical protein NQZ68_003987 [Dissostichus eleginoides]|nr:hypothetical protein NQZ68_003987 [Dissostichus eleginoides]